MSSLAVGVSSLDCGCSVAGPHWHCRCANILHFSTINCLQCDTVQPAVTSCKCNAFLLGSGNELSMTSITADDITHAKDSCANLSPLCKCGRWNLDNMGSRKDFVESKIKHTKQQCADTVTATEIVFLTVAQIEARRKDRLISPQPLQKCGCNREPMWTQWVCACGEHNPTNTRKCTGCTSSLEGGCFGIHYGNHPGAQTPDTSVRFLLNDVRHTVDTCKAIPKGWECLYEPSSPVEWRPPHTVVTEQVYKALDNAHAFLAGLQLQDQPITVQRKALDVVRQMRRALQPQNVINEEKLYCEQQRKHWERP